MEKNEKKLFSEEVLTNLKNSLPGHHYRHFKAYWAKRFGKAPVPTRQVVYHVLNGLSENDKVLQVLIDIVDDRNKLRDKIIQVTSYDRQQKAETAN